MSLVSLLKKTNKKKLFTTPSHDGEICIFHKFYQWYKSDISEVVAFKPEAELVNAEKKASEIYQTKQTKFLTNGSTSGIIASVLACCKRGDKLLIWDKAHPCHKHAGILAGAELIEYNYNYDENWGVYRDILPQQLEILLKENNPQAVIITSPTYEGFVSDIPKISEICKKNGVYLIVDEAHGALYPFSEMLPQTAIPYADFTIQSLHKTAGGINPTALLHSNCKLDINSALKIITTTSPSYPMLATIEANINYLNSQKGMKQINNLINKICEIKLKLKNIDFAGDDVTKILIKKQGISGYELSNILFNKFNIEDERTNEKSTMLLTGIGTTTKKIEQLYQALKKIN